MRLRPRPTALAASGALLLGGLLGACGGNDSAAPSADSSTDAPSSASTLSGAAAPKDADTQDFCSTYAAIVKSGESDLATEKTAIGKLNGIGTPADMPADARSGYELLVDAIGKATSESELSQLGQNLSQTDTDKLLAFSQYLTTTCADELGVASGAPSAPAAPASPSASN